MQGDLFTAGALPVTDQPTLPLQPQQLLEWQQRLHDHQAPLFRGEQPTTAQGDLFGATPTDAAAGLDPLALVPLPQLFHGRIVVGLRQHHAALGDRMGMTFLHQLLRNARSYESSK